MVIGAVTTLGLGQVWLQSWAHSGIAFPIGQTHEIELETGRSLVFYQSPHAVPEGDVVMYMWGPDDQRFRPSRPIEDNSFRTWFGGVSGRALWELDIPVAGRYRFQAMNNQYLSNDDVPAEDRVVFMKEPRTKAQMTEVMKLIHISGASVTFVLAGLLYLLHAFELRRKRGASTSSAAEFAGA